MAALQVRCPLDFTALNKQNGTSDRTLEIHLPELEESGSVNREKAFVGRRPSSTYRVTPTGRKALLNHLNVMQEVIDSVKGKIG